jgi:hypothetical protein
MNPILFTTPAVSPDAAPLAALRARRPRCFTMTGSVSMHGFPFPACFAAPAEPVVVAQQVCLPFAGHIAPKRATVIGQRRRALMDGTKTTVLGRSGTAVETMDVVAKSRVASFTLAPKAIATENGPSAFSDPVVQERATSIVSIAATSRIQFNHGGMPIATVHMVEPK